MTKLTEKEYVNERIANIKHYIKFNERENDKDFFAHKELELYKKAQKYIELTDELGCPLAVVFNLLNKEIVIFDKYIGNVLDIRKDGDVICIHYFNGTLGYDEIEPLSNYGKTFLLKEDRSE